MCNQQFAANQPASHRKRYIQIDYAKGLGILLVVLGHAIQEIHRKGVNNDFIVTVLDWIYSFHMPLFFVLSGLGFNFKYCRQQTINCFEEIKSFSRRLLIPYCVWSGIYLIGSCCLALYKKNSIISVIKEKCYAFLSMRGAAPLWFLAALFLSSTCFVFLLNNKFLRKKPLLGHLLIVSSTVGGALLAFDWFESLRYSMSKLYVFL